MRTVILVPRREGVDDRDRAWQWCKARWAALFPDFPIFEGHHTQGPFNRAKAINLAATEAGRWDFAIVIDADIFIRASQVQAAVARAKDTGRVTWAHRRWRGINEEWTRRIVADGRDFGPEIDRDDMDILVERTNPISWSCCIVFPRAVWDDMGGFDERFIGWGFEDMAVQSLVCGLYSHERIDGDVYHLWHARPFGAGRADKGHQGYTAEAITNARLGRRYMVALRRDHALHDRSDLPAGEEERKRDITNLKRDDEKLKMLADRLGLPDWSEWWPTLEELRDGAKQRHLEGDHPADPTVTVVVHTGGDADNWPTRREYLRRSFASLVKQVRGPIVQRVIYDCWGDPDVRAELEALGAPHGFYVVGPTERVGFTGSMQAMWRYLAKRAKGDYVFAVEDDFTYLRKVDLAPMLAVLRDDPQIAQMALLRDACYPDERETGGILGWPQPAFTFRDGWFEHRLFWTNNPSLFRTSITAQRWPTGHHSETLFGKVVFRDAALRGAFWGGGEEWIQHIGEVRAGSSY